MLPDPAPSAPDDDALAEFRRCAQCGYSLRGLPFAAKCPECGQAYQTDQFVISGWGAGERATAANARPAAMISLLIVTSLWGFLYAFRGLMSHDTIRVVIGLAIVALGTILPLYRRWWLRSQAPAPASVILSPSGYTQRDGFANTPLWPWKAELQVGIAPMRPERYRLSIVSPTVSLWKLDINKCPRVEFEFDCADNRAVTRLIFQLDVWRPKPVEKAKGFEVVQPVRRPPQDKMS